MRVKLALATLLAFGSTGLPAGAGQFEYGSGTLLGHHLHLRRVLLEERLPVTKVGGQGAATSSSSVGRWNQSRGQASIT